MKIKANKKYYFFDFFGTIMHRICSADDIKRIWCNRMVYQLQFVVSAREMYEMRIAGETAVSLKYNHEFLYADMLSDLYQRILCANHFEKLPISCEDFLSVGQETEIKVETEYQLLNEKLIEQVKNLRQAGKQVFILSDFYMNNKCIESFLKDKGADGLFDGVFVSCEFGKNKAYGELYSEMLEHLAVSADECCMIGDNYRSDILQAKRHGFSTVHVLHGKAYNHPINSMKILLPENRLKSRMSYSNHAFFLYRFVSLLYKELVQERISTVFFFSREGELLKKIFDIYCNRLHVKLGLPVIESVYLYVSRQATYVASLASLEDEEFSALFQQYPDLSINEFLENIGFDAEERGKLEEELQSDFSVTIENLKLSAQFEQLRKNDTFASQYSYKVEQNRNNLCRYLEQNRFMQFKYAAIVDVGWKGSIQDNLAKTLDYKMPIHGYYCGLMKEAFVCEDNKKTGLIFSEYPYRSKDCEIWKFDSSFWERLLTASHPSTRGYTEEKGRVIPVFNEFGTEEKNYQLMKPIQDEIVKKIDEISETMLRIPAFEEEIYKIFRTQHIRTCCNVSRDNMILQRALLEGHMENFGVQKTWKEAWSNAFTWSNVIVKLHHNIRKIKDCTLVATVLNRKSLYRTSALLYRFKGLAFRIRLRREEEV